MFNICDVNIKLKSQSNTNISISSIYSKIIELTYSDDDVLFSDIENDIQIKTGYKAFDSNMLITFNRFNRLDTTLPLIRNQLTIPNLDHVNDEYVSSKRNLFNYIINSKKIIDEIDQDLRIMILNMSCLKSVESNIQYLKEMRREVIDKALMHLDNIETNGRIDIVKLNSYSKTIVRYLSNNFELSLETFCDVWAISVMTPIHSWIIDVMILNNKKNNDKIDEKPIYVMGEYDKTEIELVIFDDMIDNKLEYLRNDYQSHSMLFVLNNEYVYILDSDDNDPLNGSDKFLGRSVIPSKINPPIQSVTDDIYCIFHTIFGIIDLSTFQESNDTAHSIIRKFESYQNSINGLDPKIVSSLIVNRISNLLELYPTKR